jgi:hypothetical protein
VIRTLQVTQTGSAVQVSAVPVKVKWATFVDSAAASATVGDANVSGTRGIPLAATNGVWSTPVPVASTFGTDLSQWFTFGTATQLLTVVYDDMNF